MATAAKFRIDVAIHSLLVNSTQRPPAPSEAKGLTLPEPIFPQFPERLNDPGPETPPERRKWGGKDLYRATRGWLFPYVRSRVLPGEFHPITAYLFVEYKCNLDCWYCWSYNNKVKGMTEDVARRSIDWLHDNGCRVLALMGGEPLLRPEFVHKVVYYAAKKGFWVYIATNGRLLRPEVADRLGDAGVSVFNFALDSWDLQPSLPKAFVPAQKSLEYILRKQYVNGYLVFFNMNICRNNMEDIRQLTEYAHDHRIATDYHINETPMLEQDDHFKHLYDNPTYIRPEDWREIDSLVDWLIEKNKAGYQMVNSVQRLQEIKAFVRMSSGLDLRESCFFPARWLLFNPRNCVHHPGICSWRWPKATSSPWHRCSSTPGYGSELRNNVAGRWISLRTIGSGRILADRCFPSRRWPHTSGNRERRCRPCGL